MRFLLDQSSDARPISCLRRLGHDATRIAADYPAGLPDAEVLAIAYAERRTLITDDRDFGELVFVQQQPHAGIVYFRFDMSVDPATKIERLHEVLTHYTDDLDYFLVVTRDRIRVRRS
jgi:predicted nuclease of predicted toxin-antitoxin system